MDCILFESYCIPFKQIGLDLPWQEFFFQERENSQDSTMGEKSRDYPWEGQRVLDSHILNIIKFLNDERKLSGGCCNQDDHWF